MRPVLLTECLTEILGGQRVALQIAEALQEHFRVVFACPGEGSLSVAALDLGLDVRFAPALAQGSPLAVPAGGRQLQALLNDVQPGLIYVNGLTGLPAMYWANRRSKLPLVFHLHHLVKSPLHRAAIRWIDGHNPTGKSVACSSAVAKYSGLPSQTTRILYNGVDGNRYRYQESPDMDSRIPLGSSAAQFLVAFVGDIGGIKAHELVFEAALLAVKHLPDLQILCLGRILPAGESIVAEAKASAKEAGVPDLFLFPGWRNDLHKIYPICDLTILGHDEGFSLSGLESAACGTPLALPASGGADELGALLEIGPRYAPMDSNSLAQQMIAATINPGECDRKRLAQAVSEKFSTCTFRSNILDLVDNLILR
jgi:glycosyltransferase involved in cell wall biosynthesis